MSFSEIIPGETPITDFSELKVEGIRYRRELNEAEATNIAKPMARYLGSRITEKEAPMDFSWFCRLHREMFEDVWAWAGRLRRLETTIGIAPEHIEQRLYELAGNFPLWTDVPVVERAAMLHHKAVQIHPFENGNGRWSRLLANIWLRLNDEPIALWPGDALSVESPIRGEYLEAIRAADKGRYGPLVDLHERFRE